MNNIAYNSISVNTMPGHIKKTDGPDPDPSPWLIVSDELKVKLKSKPYDPKKSCWVPDKATGGYWEALIDSTDGEKVSVKILDEDSKPTGDVSTKFGSNPRLLASDENIEFFRFSYCASETRA